jgi:hypothetical protein
MKKFVITLFTPLCLLFAAAVSNAETLRGTFADIPVHEAADPASAVIGTLGEGEVVDVVEREGDFYKVNVPGDENTTRIGYVLADLVDVVDTNASHSPADAPATDAATPVAQGSPIPPTATQLRLRREALVRLATAKAEVEARQAELEAIQNGTAQAQSPQRSPAAPRAPQTRAGLWFNGGLGFGSFSCNGCDGRLSGLSGGLSLGTTIDERLLVGIGTAGYARSVDGTLLSVGTLDARARFYPVRTSGFFMTGGLGLGTLSVDSITEHGVAAVLGLGWDVRVRPNLSLTPFWNGIGISAGPGEGFGQLGLGITVH